MDDIHIVRLKPQPIVVVERQATANDLPAMLGEALQVVSDELAQVEVQPVGPAVVRYTKIGDNSVTLEAGFPVEAPVQTLKRALNETLPGGEAAMSLHVGRYDELDAVHESIKAWIAKQGRQPAGACWEVYSTDPSVQHNAAKWQTEVYWPLR